jgi:hypothetical protein
MKLTRPVAIQNASRPCQLDTDRNGSPTLEPFLKKKKNAKEHRLSRQAVSINSICRKDGTVVDVYITKQQTADAECGREHFQLPATCMGLSSIKQLQNPRAPQRHSSGSKKIRLQSINKSIGPK